LVFSEENHEQLSLLDLKCDLLSNSNCQISQEAIHKKFTPEAVSFLQSIISKQILNQVILNDKEVLEECGFTALNIKDSSKFKLPKEFLPAFGGYGSFNKNTSLMNIQYEYDLFTGNWKSLEFTQATRNDQQDSMETIDQIQARSLNIRDLGYITTTYLQAVTNQKAYFLNRLPKANVYVQKQGDYIKLDWKKLDKEMKNGKFMDKQLEIYLFDKKREKIKCRMVLLPVPDEVKNERIRKAKIGGQRTNGYQLSYEYKIKAGYNIFITNVPEEILSSDQISQVYRLRWQIELIFKVWKSNLNIHKIKPMKLERMLCQLYAKFIWVLLITDILKLSNKVIQKVEPDQICSPAKFFKRAKKFCKELQSIFTYQLSLCNWFEQEIIPLIPSILIEKRMKQPTHYQLLYNIFVP
jgi:hypothetical protein